MMAIWIHYCKIFYFRNDVFNSVLNVYQHLYMFNLRCVNTLRPRQNDRHFADYIFKRIFFNEILWILGKISSRYVPCGSNWQYSSIASDNGVAPNRRQAIIWSNSGMFCWCIYASLGLNESICPIVDEMNKSWHMQNTSNDSVMLYNSPSRCCRFYNHRAIMSCANFEMGIVFQFRLNRIKQQWSLS